MRRLPPALTIAALLGLAVTSAQEAKETKIGVFDFQRILQETEEGKRVKAHLDEYQRKKAAEIGAKEKEAAEVQKQLQAQALSLSPDKRSAMEKDLQKKILDVNQMREAAQRELELELREAEDRFADQTGAVVEQFARDEGFDLLFERRAAAYANNTLDVTTALVDRFNKMVPAPAAAPAGKDKEQAPAKPAPSAPVNKE